MSAYIELKIVQKILQAAEISGCRFAVSYENGFDVDDMVWTKEWLIAMKHIRQADEETILIDIGGKMPEKGYEAHGDAWIKLIYGNGDDGLHVVSDYTTNIPHIVATAEYYVEAVEKLSTGVDFLDGMSTREDI